MPGKSEGPTVLVKAALTMPRPDPPREVSYVFATRPRCPHCGSARLKTYKSLVQADDTLLRYVLCLECHARIKIVLE